MLLAGALGVGLDARFSTFCRAGNEVPALYVTSPTSIEEMEAVLNSKKFGLSHNEVGELTQPLLEMAEIVIRNEVVRVIERCPSDNRVLECAPGAKIMKKNTSYVLYVILYFRFRSIGR